MVTGAEQYVSRLVVPRSNAAKALRRLASPHFLASLSQLQKVVERAHRDYDAASEPVRRHTKKRCGGGRLRVQRPDRGRPRADELRGHDERVNGDELELKEDEGIQPPTLRPSL
jgi:hypothetical protein